MADAAGRVRQKSDRRDQLLTAAAQLMAERGYTAVRLEDIGAAAGVSGPAIYRHFTGKEALLVELLVGISARLLAGSQSVVADATGAAAALDGLIEFHLDFTLTEPDLIRIQDRDLPNLPTVARRQVRRGQRRYLETWVEVLVGVHNERATELAAEDARVMVHAAFGLLNSTAHSIKSSGTRSVGRSREVLRTMTRAALAAPQPQYQ